MTDTPKDGDFAAHLAKKAADAPPPPTETLREVMQQRTQTIEDILLHGAEPTDEFIAGMKEEAELPELSDEEFERQALEAGGDDGDPKTPE